MLHTLKKNWSNYLIEAWALGMFMLSATFFAGLLNLPSWPVRAALGEPIARRVCMGAAMGLTAIGLIYSGWGKRSGAHMNPALTFSFWYLGKIGGYDACWYILAQCLGGTGAMVFAASCFPAFAGAPEVNYVQTLPGSAGPGVAFAAEFAISFLLLLVVLYSANGARTAKWTGVFAGLLLFLYIVFEDPFSGVSMNPARSLASAVPARNFMYFWIYFSAPVLGMWSAASAWKAWICRNPAFRCSYHG